MLLWPFNKYPGTDYETFNWEWILKTVKDYTEKVDAFTEDMTENWNTFKNFVTHEIAEMHRKFAIYVNVTEEALNTGAIADGAITEQKIQNAFLKRITNYWVTPEMFGATGDGVTDDSAAFQDAIDSGYNIIVPGKTYHLTHGLVISTPVIISGVENTKLTYNSTDYLFTVKTKYRRKTKIMQMEIEDVSYSTNGKFLLVDAEQWGGSVDMSDIDITGFNQDMFRLRSVMVPVFTGVTMWSEGPITFEPYDSTVSAPQTVSHSVRFTNCYYHSTNPNMHCIMFLKNTRDFKAESCSFERAYKCFDLSEDCRNIVFSNSWFENITELYTSANSTKPIFRENRTGGDLVKFDGNQTVVDEWENYNNTQYVRFFDAISGLGDMYRKIWTAADDYIFKQAIAYSTAISGYKTLFKIGTKGADWYIPTNIRREYTNTNTISFDLGDLLGSQNVSCMYELYMDIHYQGGSHNLIEKKLIQLQTGTYAEHDTEFFEKSSWGVAQSETGTFTREGNVLTFTSNQTVTYAHLVVKYTPFGNAMRSDNS